MNLTLSDKQLETLLEIGYNITLEERVTMSRETLFEILRKAYMLGLLRGVD